MECKDLIFRRKTTRSFSMEPVENTDLRRIRDFMAECRPLYPALRVRGELIGIDAVRCILPWKAPHYIAIFTEEGDGAWENVGFLFQQVELFIQSLGLGACWLGMGKLDPRGDSAPKTADGLQFAIMMAFGRPKGELLRTSPAQFRRKAPSEIADREDPRLEPARLAPSSVNSQPWYFVHHGDTIHAYQAMQGIFRQKSLGNMNRIDMGIALAQLYVANPDTFQFFTVPNPPEIKGRRYTGSFRL